MGSVGFAGAEGAWMRGAGREPDDRGRTEDGEQTTEDRETVRPGSKRVKQSQFSAFFGAETVLQWQNKANHRRPGAGRQRTEGGKQRAGMARPGVIMGAKQSQFTAFLGQKRGSAKKQSQLGQAGEPDDRGRRTEDRESEWLGAVSSWAPNEANSGGWGQLRSQISNLRCPRAETGLVQGRDQLGGVMYGQMGSLVQAASGVEGKNDSHVLHCSLSYEYPAPAACPTPRGAGSWPVGVAENECLDTDGRKGDTRSRRLLGQRLSRGGGWFVDHGIEPTGVENIQRVFLSTNYWLRSNVASMVLYRSIFLVCVLLCGVSTAATSPQMATLRLATGSKTGVYYPIGCGIKAAIEEAYPNEVTIEVVETSGTLENLRLIDREQVDLALVQNDTAYYFSHGELMFSLPSSKAQAVASLYTELIQIVATRKSEIKYLDQLKGRRIRTGSPPQNISNSATRIFALAGWEAMDLTDVRCKFSEAREMMLANSLDGAFLTAGIPTPLLTETIDGISLQDHVTLVPIKEGLANRLIRAFPYFVYTEIPAETYRGQEDPVPTMGVRAILVARRGFEDSESHKGNVPVDFVHTLTGLIFEKEDVIRSRHGVEGADLSRFRLSEKESLDGILDQKMRPIIPIHPQARAYFNEKGLLQKSLADYWPMILWSAVCVTALGYVVKYRSVIQRVTQRHIHVRLALIFACLYVLGTLAMYFCERYQNRSFESVSESFWSITVYLFSGFEDRYPVTWAGRVISVLIFVLSVFFFGAVAGRFAAAFLRKEEVKMPKDLHNHIVICNWNERGKRVVSELRHPEGKPDADVVIIDDKVLDEKALMRIPEFNNIYCINDDPIRHGTLKKAKVSLADTIIVLADTQSPDPDAKSAMIILALLSECKTRRPHIIAEVVNSDNSQHLKDAGADETICTAEIGVGILAHCAVNKQLSVVYKDLLTYSFEGNEIYVIPRQSFPDMFVGKTFAECARLLDEHRDNNNPVILLGIRRQHQVIMNPRRHEGSLEGEECRIEEDDALIAMAFCAPNLTAVFKES